MFLLIFAQCKGRSNCFYCNNRPTLYRPVCLTQFITGLPALNNIQMMIFFGDRNVYMFCKGKNKMSRLHL